MAQGSMKLFFAMLFDKADQQDDMLKIKAKTKPQAVAVAKSYIRDRGNRFDLGPVFTRKQLKKTQPEWHALLWGSEAIEAPKICFEDLDYRE